MPKYWDGIISDVKFSDILTDSIRIEKALQISQKSSDTKIFGRYSFVPKSNRLKILTLNVLPVFVFFGGYFVVPPSIFCDTKLVYTSWKGIKQYRFSWTVSRRHSPC